MEQNLQALSKQERLDTWTTRIMECRNSGMSVRSWCQENGLNEKTYYYWQRRLFRALSAQQECAGSGYRPNCRSRSRHPRRSRCGNRGNGAPAAEIMLSDFTGADKVYIACGYTDLRRGIDGLASIVQESFQLDPFTNTLFLFCGRRRDRIKALYWEGNGFVLLYKRLESGSFQWPRSTAEARLLTPQQYRWLMEGLSVDQPKAHKPVNGLEIV